MLNLYPILLTEQEKPASLPIPEALNDSLPPLWSQMDPASRQRLSQMIAELIRRIWFPFTEKEKEVGNDAAA
jgi:hypothetical protein